MPISNIIVGRNIAMRRSERGLTQQQLASVLGVSHQAVSKWENGAALPDIESLLSLSKLFGVTIEQLLSAQSPEDEMSKSAKEDHPETEYMLDGVKDAYEHAINTSKDLGNAIMSKVNKVIGDINVKPDYEHMVKTSKDFGSAIMSKVNKVIGDIGGKPESQKSDESNAPEANEEAPNYTMSIQALIDLAPFMSREKVSAIALRMEQPLDADKLCELAPFLTRDALSELIDEIDLRELGMGRITILAPFLKQDTLFKLVMTNVDKLDATSLRELAPFLKKGMVDTLVDAINNVRRAVTIENMTAFADKTAKSVSGLFERIAETFNSLEQKATEQTKVDEYEDRKADDDGAEESKVTDAEENPASDDEAELSESDKAYRDALNARSWNWIRLNLSSVRSDALMTDTIMTAAKELNAEDARDIMLSAAPYLSQTAFKDLVLKLCKSGFWGRVCDLLPLTDEENANEILPYAADGGKKALDAVRLYAPKASKSTWNAISQKAISEDNWELVNALTENI